MEHRGPQRGPVHPLAAGVVLSALAVVASALVVVLMVLDGFEVTSPGQLSAVELGLPFDWVSQQQVVDPPLPYRAGFESPRETPTQVDGESFALDVLLVWLVLAGGWRLTRARRR